MEKKAEDPNDAASSAPKRKGSSPRVSPAKKYKRGMLTPWIDWTPSDAFPDYNDEETVSSLREYDRLRKLQKLLCRYFQRTNPTVLHRKNISIKLLWLATVSATPSDDEMAEDNESEQLNDQSGTSDQPSEEEDAPEEDIMSSCSLDTDASDYSEKTEDIEEREYRKNLKICSDYVKAKELRKLAENGNVEKPAESDVYSVSNELVNTDRPAVIETSGADHGANKPIEKSGIGKPEVEVDGIQHPGETSELVTVDQSGKTDQSTVARKLQDDVTFNDAKQPVQQLETEKPKDGIAITKNDVNVIKGTSNAEKQTNDVKTMDVETDKALEPKNVVKAINGVKEAGEDVDQKTSLNTVDTGANDIVVKKEDSVKVPNNVKEAEAAEKQEYPEQKEESDNADEAAQHNAVAKEADVEMETY